MELQAKRPDKLLYRKMTAPKSEDYKKAAAGVAAAAIVQNPLALVSVFGNLLVAVGLKLSPQERLWSWIYNSNVRLLKLMKASVSEDYGSKRLLDKCFRQILSDVLPESFKIDAATLLSPPALFPYQNLKKQLGQQLPSLLSTQTAESVLEAMDTSWEESLASEFVSNQKAYLELLMHSLYAPRKARVIYQDKQMTITVEGDVGDFDVAKTIEVLMSARSEAEDTSINIADIDEGNSVRITFTGSPDGLARLAQKIDSGELTSLGGLKILNYDANPIEENVVSQSQLPLSTTTIRSMPVRELWGRMLGFAVREVEGKSQAEGWQIIRTWFETTAPLPARYSGRLESLFTLWVEDVLIPHLEAKDRKLAEFLSDRSTADDQQRIADIALELVDLLNYETITAETVATIIRMAVITRFRDMDDTGP